MQCCGDVRVVQAKLPRKDVSVLAYLGEGQGEDTVVSPAMPSTR
jgi:hypothetical protein